MTALVLTGWISPATAEDTSNYCAEVDTDDGTGTVATGFWYTDENGRRYCRQIPVPANYVCLVDGRLPTVTTTISRTTQVWRRAEITYTFDHVIRRPRPAYGSYTDDEIWAAQYEPELYRLYQPGETVPNEPPTRSGWVFVRTTLTILGGNGYFETTTEDVEVEVIVDDFHNRDGNCTPAVDAMPRYDTIPAQSSAPSRTERQICHHEALNATPRLFDYVCDGSIPIQRVQQVQGGNSHIVNQETEDGIVQETCTEVESYVSASGTTVTGYWCE